MLNFLLNHKSNSVSKSAGILTISAVLSRLLGVLRDWLLARTFGAGSELDVYFTAFKIPDFIYNILILGGVMVSFLPLFSDYFSKNREEGWRFASNLLNIFLLLLVFLNLILFFFVPALINLIAPGFNYQEAEQAILLTRIMLLSPIFFGLSSIFSGILQYFKKFLVYSLCPLIYNLSIIIGILFLTPHFGILGVVFGVVFGSFLHFLIQLPSVLNSGFHYNKYFNFQDNKIKKVFHLMVPRMFGVSAQQINLIFINAIASTLAKGSITIFNFTNNIQHVPIGIIGVPFAVAVFPVLSQNWARQETEKFINNFSLSFNKIVYLVFPVTSLVFVLREEIIDLLLENGEFSLMAAQLSSASLALFCLGIFASTLIPLLFRAFFSLQDTKTPTLIALFSVLLNLGLSYLFTHQLFILHQFFRNVFSFPSQVDVAVLGLPLAFSISVIVQFFLMLFFVKKKASELKLKSIFLNFLKVLFSSSILILISYLLKSFMYALLNFPSLIMDLIVLVFVGLISCLVYLLITFVLSLPMANLVINQFFKNEN